MQSDRASGVPYNGPRATYVVLSTITTLILSLLISIWHGDFSAVVAAIGLVAIYIGSAELLALYSVLAPSSLVVDIIWLAASRGSHNGHGWLIFLTLLDMLSKVVGAVMAWSLYSSGDGQYAPISLNAHGSASAPPPVSAQAPAYHPPPSYAPPDDPFASYAPPRLDHHSGGGQVPAYQQPFPTSQAPAQIV